MEHLPSGEPLRYERITLAVQKDAQASTIDQETQWIAAAQADPAAFEPLYLRYRARIYHYLRTRLDSDEDAADLAQQVFLQAIDALPRYRLRGAPFAVWLFRIARNAALNLASRRPSCVSWDALPEIFSSATEQEPEATAIHQETLRHLRTLLATLSADKRELLALRFATGLTSTQIAALVGKKPEAVKKQITRLLQSLKEHYHYEHP